MAEYNAMKENENKMLKRNWYGYVQLSAKSVEYRVASFDEFTESESREGGNSKPTIDWKHRTDSAGADVRLVYYTSSKSKPNGRKFVGSERNQIVAKTNE